MPLIRSFFLLEIHERFLQMKRKNIFWTAWAIIGLTLVVAAGVKSFANEVRDKIERSALKYLPCEK